MSTSIKTASESGDGVSSSSEGGDIFDLENADSSTADGAVQRIRVTADYLKIN